MDKIRKIIDEEDKRLHQYKPFLFFGLMVLITATLLAIGVME